MKMKKAKVWEFLGVSLVGWVVLATAAIVYAAASYQVNYGATSTIDEWSTCKKITNSSGNGLAIFVPTNTSAEWNAFYSNKPTGVTEAGCSPTISSMGVGSCNNGYMDTAPANGCNGSGNFSPSTVTYLSDGLTSSGSSFLYNNAAKVTLSGTSLSTSLRVYHIDGKYLSFYYSSDGVNWTRTASGYAARSSPHTEVMPDGYQYLGVGSGQSGQAVYEIQIP